MQRRHLLQSKGGAEPEPSAFAKNAGDLGVTWIGLDG